MEPGTLPTKAEFEASQAGYKAAYEAEGLKVLIYTILCFLPGMVAAIVDHQFEFQVPKWLNVVGIIVFFMLLLGPFMLFIPWLGRWEASLFQRFRLRCGGCGANLQEMGHKRVSATGHCLRCGAEVWKENSEGAS